MARVSKNWFIFFPLCFLLAACINLGRQFDVQSYNLSANLPSSQKHYAHKPLTVLVNFGQAAPGLQSDRMAYQHAGNNEMQYYAYHRWVSPPAALVANSLGNALSNTDAFKAVVNAPLYVGKVDEQIGVALVRLQQNFLSDSKSRVDFAVQLVVVDVQTNRVLASKRFEALVDASPNSVGFAAAANQALTQLMPKMVQFVYQNS